MKGRTKLDQSEAGGDFHRPFCTSHSGQAAWPWWDWDATSLSGQASSKLQTSLQESRERQRAAEINVDTGLAVANPVSGRCPLNRFSRDLRSSLLQPQAPMDTASSTRDRTQLLFAAAKRSKGARHRASGFPWQTLQDSPAGRAKEEEEEFFI